MGINLNTILQILAFMVPLGFTAWGCTFTWTKYSAGIKSIIQKIHTESIRKLETKVNGLKTDSDELKLKQRKLEIELSNVSTSLIEIKEEFKSIKNQYTNIDKSLKELMGVFRVERRKKPRK